MSHMSVYMFRGILPVSKCVYAVSCSVYPNRRRNVSSDIVGRVQLDAGHLDSCQWTAASLDLLKDL